MKFDPYNNPWPYIFAALVVGILIAVTFNAAITHASLNEVHKWQGLLAGGTAIIAAFIGGMFIRRSDELKKQDRAKAEKAVLAAYLSEAEEYCNRCMHLASQLYDNALAEEKGEAHPHNTSILEMPSLTESLIRCFQANIEFGPENVGYFLSKFLTSYQVQYVRLLEGLEIQRGHDSFGVRVLEIPSAYFYRIWESATLSAIKDKLYDYSRHNEAPEKSAVEYISVLTKIRIIHLDLKFNLNQDFQEFLQLQSTDNDHGIV